MSSMSSWSCRTAGLVALALSSVACGALLGLSAEDPATSPPPSDAGADAPAQVADGDAPDAQGVDAQQDAPAEAGKPPMFVFVTTEPLAGDRVYSAGREACANEASFAGLKGRFLPLIGGLQSIELPTAGGPWYLVGAPTKLIAKDFDALKVKVEAPIDRNASGLPRAKTAVWSGLSADLTPSSYHCLSWDSNDAQELGRVGSMDKANGEWISQGLESCVQPHPVYCFQASF
jgi:hypothetical protein